MPVPFDPYQQWLGIPQSQQPPTHYRLLGLEPFELRGELIRTAAEQKTAYLRWQLAGEHAELARRLLVEVTAASDCLSDPAARAAYDEQLGRPTAAPAPPPAAPPVVAAYVPDGAPQQEESWRSGASPAKAALMFGGAFLASFVLVVGLFLWSTAPPREVAVRKPASPDKEATLTVEPPSDLPDAAEDTPTPAVVDQPPGNPPLETAAPAPQATPISPTPEVTAPATPPTSPPATPASPPVEPSPIELSPNEPASPPSPDTPPPAANRAPTPTIDQQQAVRQQLAEVYNLQRQRTPEDNQKLAEQLMDLARKSPERSAERFVLLRAVIDRAGEGGDAALMLDAVDAMGADFDIDVLDFKQMVLNAFAQHASSAEAMQSLVDSTMAAVDDAVGREDYAAAMRLIGPAYAAARRPSGGSYRKEVSDRRDEIEKLLAQRRQIDQALAVLKNDPDNAEANLAVGLWYGLVKDDWDQALPHLAKGDDSQLQLVAKRELIATADDTDEQVAVGDAWYDLAQTRQDDQRAAFMRRAGSWYERAHDAVSSTLLVAKLDKRLDEIANLDRPKSDESQSGLRPGDSLPVLKWVELSQWIDAAGDGVSGKWEKKGSEVRVASASHARLRLPVSIEGNYDLQFGFTRTKGNDAITVVLPVGKKSCVAVFSGGGGKYSGLEMLAKKSANNNASTKKPTKLNNGQRYTIQIRVRLVGEIAVLEAAVNGMPYLRARGPQDSLDASRQWAVSPPDRLALGANQSSVTFRNIQLRVVRGGSGKLVASPKPGS